VAFKQMPFTPLVPHRYAPDGGNCSPLPGNCDPLPLHYAPWCHLRRSLCGFSSAVDVFKDRKQNLQLPCIYEAVVLITCSERYEASWHAASQCFPDDFRSETTISV